MSDVALVSEASRDADGDASGRVSLPDGGHLAFEMTGGANPGTPVLLVRPLAGSMAMWGAFRDALAREFRVVAYDPRGVGGSSDAPLDVTTREMARDAADLLAALRIERARVFGISLGAMVCTWLAVDAPSRLEKLCLASAGPVGFALTPAGVARGVEMAASLLAPDGEVVRRLADALISPEVRAEEPARIESVDAAAAEEPARRVELVKHGVAAARHDARAVLDQITTPTLVLAGARDTLLGTDPQRELAEGIAGARLVVVDDAGHDLTLEQPDETARLVAAFFR